MKIWEVHITESFDFEVLAHLKSSSKFNITMGGVESLDLSRLQHLEILIIRSKTQVSRELLVQLTNLKLIISCTAGFDHIDLSILPDFKQLQVCHVPEAHTLSAAELTWALLLSCTRKIAQAQSATKKGQWDRSPLIGSELAKKTLGIVGLGRIGRQVAKIAHAFEMEIVAFDPYIEDQVFETSMAQRVSFQELITVADIVTFHVPSSPETSKMLRASNLEDLARGVTIINTSRGDVLDPALLNEGLKKGYIVALGLDVHAKEPLPVDTYYLNHPHCVCTPHIGAQTVEALKKVSQQAYQKLIQFTEGQPLSDTLPPDALWYRSPMGFVDG